MGFKVAERRKSGSVDHIYNFRHPSTKDTTCDGFRCIQQASFETTKLNNQRGEHMLQECKLLPPWDISDPQWR